MLKRKAILWAAGVVLAVARAGLADDGEWAIDAAGAWTTGDNTPWQGGIVASGIDATAYFDKVDLTGKRAITLSAPLTIGHMVFGDLVSSHDRELTQTGGSALTLATSEGNPTPSITVINRTAEIRLQLVSTQGLTKLGGGTLSIINTPNISGLITVAGGTLTIAHSYSNDFQLNSGTTLALGPGNLTLSGKISGAGKLQPVNSTAVVLLTNDNDFTGGVQMQDGTILLSTAANHGIGTGTILVGFGGTLASSDGNARTINNTFNLNNAGGTLRFGRDGFTGDLTFTDSTSGSAMSSAGSIRVFEGVTVTLNKRFTSGNIKKRDAGTLVLNGSTMTYTGATWVHGGTLLINGAKSGGTAPIIVNEPTIDDGLDAVLGGIGSVTNDVSVLAGGTIAPGTVGQSIGHFTVGNTDFEPTATLAIELGAGQSDRLIVNGDLDIGGAVLSLSGTLDGVSNYVIATYTGTLTGSFAGPVIPDGYTLDYGTRSNGQITLFVPEPSSLAVLGMCMAGLLARRRRGKLV